MKLVEILKNQGLTEEQIRKITASMKENKVYETSLENADERYAKLKKKNTEIQNSLDVANATIDDLEKNASTIEDLKNKVAKYEKEKSEAALNNAINELLKEHNVKNLKVFKRTLDMETIKFEDGKLIGVLEQIEAYKKSDPYLFDEKGGTGSIDEENQGSSGNTTSLGEKLAKQQISQVDNNKTIDNFFN